MLAQLLTEEESRIGEIILSRHFSLRHREDLNVDPSELQLHQHPEAAREIARYDAAGNYRPLKSAPNLRRGWLLQLRGIDEMALALDFFYPAALSLYGAWLEKKLQTTSFRETLNRQSGMYRVAQKLSEEEADVILRKNCQEGCLRKTLWAKNSGEEALLFSDVEEQKIPLLCREACNLLVAAARGIVKERE